MLVSGRPLGLLLQILFPFRTLANLRGDLLLLRRRGRLLGLLRLRVRLADLRRVDLGNVAVLILALAPVLALQDAAVDETSSLPADERMVNTALARNLPIRPLRPLRILEQRLNGAALVLGRSVSAVRVVRAASVENGRPLRALAVDRLVYLSLDRLALERLRRADTMKPVREVVLRSVSEHDDRRKHRAVLHRLRVL